MSRWMVEIRLQGESPNLSDPDDTAALQAAWDRLEADAKVTVYRAECNVKEERSND